MMFFKHRLLHQTPLWLMLCFSFTLDAAPQTASEQAFQVNFGQPASITVDLGTASTQVAVQPAGPYATHRIQLASRPLHQAMLNSMLIVATENSQLLRIDFNNKPAVVHQLAELDHNINDLVATKEVLLVAGDNKLLTYFADGNQGLSTALEYTTNHHIKAISAHHQRACLLLKDNTVELIELKKPIKHLGKFKLNHNINSVTAKNSSCYISGDKLALAEIDFTATDNPTLVNQFQTSGVSHSIFVADNVAYSANGPDGFAVFELRNNITSRWLGSHNKLGHIDDISVYFGMALVNNNNQRIVSVNVSNPLLPITDSFYKPNHKIQHMLSQWPIAYVATSKGIERVDFSRSANIQISNEGINQGGSRRAFIRDNIAYVADWFSGLHIYDITQPHQPRHLSNFHTPGSSKGVVVKGDYAFVGDDDHGLQVIDISDPLHPKWVSQVLSTGLAYTMKMIDDLIYLADHRGGFHIIDVSNVKSPKIVGSFDTPSKSWAIDVTDNIAYVADDASGLLIFDVRNPDSIQQIAQFNPGGYAEDVKVIANHAYVTFFDKGLYILDISNPRNPVELGHTPIPGNARSVSILGQYAYIAAWESGLQIVDVGKPDSPEIASYVDTDGSAWGLDIYKNHAYIWDWWGGVKVVDVTRPLRPRLVANYHANSLIQKLSLHKDFLYTASGSNGIQAYDINNPLNPIWATGLDIKGYVKDVVIQDKYAYIAAGDGGIHIADISDPFYIKWLSQLPTVNEIQQLYIQGTILIAKNNLGELLKIDASNPENLILRKRLPASVRDFTLHNGLLFATNEHGLSVYQLNNDFLKPLAEYSLSTDFHQVRGNGQFIFVYEKNQGVHILKLTNLQFESVAKFNIHSTISDIQLTNNSMYLSSETLGLLRVDISNIAQPVLTTRYPATGTVGSFVINEQAAFFAGTKSITSVDLLPDLKLKRPHTKHAKFELPNSMPVGQYYLTKIETNGEWRVIPDLLTVKMKKSNKPKFTMEDFKKIMEQKKLQETP